MYREYITLKILIIKVHDKNGLTITALGYEWLIAYILYSYKSKTTNGISLFKLLVNLINI